MIKRKKNKRVTKRMSRSAVGSGYILGMVVLIAVAVVLNTIAESNCEQVTNSIGEKERQIKSLEDQKVREAARWQELKTIDKIEERLCLHGMKMAYPHPHQIIRLTSDGKVLPGQQSVALARKRSQSRMASTSTYRQHR